MRRAMNATSGQPVTPNAGPARMPGTETREYAVDDKVGPLASGSQHSDSLSDIAIEQAATGLAVCAGDGSILRANPALVALLGVSDVDLRRWRSTATAGLAAAGTEALSALSNEPVTLRYLDDSDRSRWLRLSAQRSRRPGGCVVAAVADVTQQAAPAAPAAEPAPADGSVIDLDRCPPDGSPGTVVEADDGSAAALREPAIA